MHAEYPDIDRGAEPNEAEETIHGYSSVPKGCTGKVPAAARGGRLRPVQRHQQDGARHARLAGVHCFEWTIPREVEENGMAGLVGESRVDHDYGHPASRKP
jgi:hypothetical protein